MPDNSPSSHAARPRNRSQRQIDESLLARERILDAATAIFASKGYTETTLAEVAQGVGLTRPGLLHHFGSKDALFRAVLDHEKDWADTRVGLHASMADLRGFVGGDEQARVPLQLLHVVEGEMIAGNEIAAPWVRERTAWVRAEIRQRLKSARAAGTIDDRADIEVQALLLAASINGLQKLWLLEPGLDTRAAVDLLLRSLAVAPQTEPSPAVAEEPAKGGRRARTTRRGTTSRGSNS